MSYTMRLATGEVLAGVDVHGSGGALREATDGARRLRKAIERATAGRPMVGIYEPRPGHVRVYRESAAGFADERVVDLRGAALLGAP